MSGYIESEALFKQRCAEMGLTVAHRLDLVAASYSTIGCFAYGCSYVPGAPDDGSLNEAYIDFAISFGGSQPLRPALYLRYVVLH